MTRSAQSPPRCATPCDTDISRADQELFLESGSLSGVALTYSPLPTGCAGWCEGSVTSALLQPCSLCYSPKSQAFSPEILGELRGVIGLDHGIGHPLTCKLPHGSLSEPSRVR